MAEEDGAAKPYDPTPRKLQKAREKGEIPRSPDVMAFAAYLGFLIAILALAPAAGRRMMDVGGRLIQDADRLAADALSGSDLIPRALIGVVLQMAAWWIALPALLVSAAIVATRAWVFAPTRLEPKLSRISPIQGAKNKFGANGFFEFAKSSVKMTVYAVLLGGILWSSADRIAAAAALPMGQGMALMMRLLLGFLAAVAAISAAIAAID